MAETGLQRHIEVEATRRHRRTAAWLHSADEQSCARMAGESQVRSLAVLWMALSGGAAFVWLVEMVGDAYQVHRRSR